MGYFSGGILKKQFLVVDYYNHVNEIIAPGGALKFVTKRFDDWGAWDGTRFLSPKNAVYVVSSHIRARDNSGAFLYGYTPSTGYVKGAGVNVNTRYSGIFYLRQNDFFELRTLEGYNPSSTSFEPLHYITISGWEI